jgi:hypothetical protein
MAAPWITLFAIAALALVYVIAPICAGVFFRFRRPRTMRCPETGVAVELTLDARHAALTAVPGPPRMRVMACTLWPDRKGCAQRCLAEPAAR